MEGKIIMYIIGAMLLYAIIQLITKGPGEDH